MSKAIANAAIGAVEIAAGAVLIATGGGAGFGLALVMTGASTEIAAIAELIAPSEGMSETVRQPAAPRQIVYGTQRVGAIEVFESTTGSSKDQYNLVLVFATHEITAFENLYLDGRQVFWAGSGDGYSVRNGFGFGGGADGQDHTGPDGATYNFANASSGHEGVWVAARFGDQAAGDVMGELTANDPRWAADGKGNSPYGGGCAYLYVKLEYDTSVFPGKPDIKATIKGKACYDPRTGETAYTDNWALIVGDILRDPIYGLGDANINEEQWIAAANICDEQVACAAGMESRYACHYRYSTDTPIGNVLKTLANAAAGRISNIGGEWWIYPGTYIGPSASFGPDSLIDKPTWSAQRPFRDKVNRVQGCFTAANYPYNVAGDYYDKNGWSPDGTVDNTFGMQFAPTNYPTYAADVLHGYASDQYLNEDGGTLLPLNLDLPAVLSISQAQRLAKIALLRNRQQGSGMFVMGPAGYQLQAGDTFYMTFAQRGWTNKLLEANKVDFVLDRDSSGMPMVKTVVSVNETDASVYEFDPTEELTAYDIPANPNPTQSYITAPPTSVELISSAATALTQPDGTVTPRIQVSWNTPLDTRVATIEMQYRLTGAPNWSDGGTPSVVSNLSYIAPVIAGQNYDVRIRSRRANGGTSVWVEIDAFTASLVISVSSEDAIGQKSLVGEAYEDGTAAIECQTFTAPLGGRNVTYFPDTQTISGLLQQTLYYVYVVDPDLAGGDLTPVATQNQLDYAGKLGYYLIGSIVTPYCSPSGTQSRYLPTVFSDTGTRTTSSPECAFDNDLSTCAQISGSMSSLYLEGEHGGTHTTTARGACSFSGFPAVVTSSDLKLYISITASADGQVAPPATLALGAFLGGAVVAFPGFGPTETKTTLSIDVPSGVDLSTISVSGTVNPGTGAANEENPDTYSEGSISIFEIYVDV